MDYSAEAKRIIRLAIVKPDATDEVAAALAAAEKRGRVAGLREAAQLMAAEDVALDMRPASMSGDYASRRLARRAEEVERS